jgi:chromosomal replication initiator protein
MSQIAPSVRAEDVDTDRVLAALQARLGPQKYNAWFRHGTRISIVSGHVRVSVPNSFVANWVDSHYRADVAEVVQELTGLQCPVLVTVDPELTGRLRKRQLDQQAEIVSRANAGRARPREPRPQPQLRFRLQDFVVGHSNRLAFSAARALLTPGGAPFQTLFVHGSCGVGKTHLLQGICSSFSAGKGPERWRYVTGEQFTNEFVRAIRQKKFTEFRARYRQLELLAIDDVHFLASKKAVQEEFLHTFNAIEAAGRRVVLASDAHPHMVGELNAQLSSRFIAGMVVRVDPPDEEMRLEVLRRKARELKLQIDPEVLGYVARHIRSSVRELEGAAFKLAAMADLAEKPVTLQTAREALGDFLARTDSALTLGDIESATSAFFGVTPADIHSSRRTRTVSTARMVTMFLARRHTPMSYPEIGRFTGKNHSSAVLAVKRMEAALDAGADLKWNTAAGSQSMPAADIVRRLNQELC